jgi:hypothetical protein
VFEKLVLSQTGMIADQCSGGTMESKNKEGKMPAAQ